MSDTTSAVDVFASSLAHEAIQSAYDQVLYNNSVLDFDSQQRLAEDFPTLKIYGDVCKRMETATIINTSPVRRKSAIHSEPFKDGRKRSVTFDPKFVKGELRADSEF